MRERARRGSPGFGVSSAASARWRATGRRRVDAVAGENGAGVGEGGGVGDRRPRGDDARIVAGDVGDEEAHRLGREGRGGQPAALDRGEMLPDRVHRRDVGAGGEQRAVHRLLVLERDPLGGESEQRRSAARDQAEHQVVRPGALGQREDAPRRVPAARIGHRVRGLDDLDPLAGDAVPGAGDDEALERPLPVLLHRARHRGRGLARAEHDGAALRRLRQVRRHDLRRQGRRDRGVEKGAEEGAGVGHSCRGSSSGGRRWPVTLWVCSRKGRISMLPISFIGSDSTMATAAARSGASIR